jgi:alkanesulfonate monooxygenase SsuD/methylene tetrahydromethanopterin reductase-like flavin-dependent oxidoreductase (luciferase family)
MYGDQLAMIHDAAKKSGRAESDITPGLYVLLTSIADTTEEAQKQLEPLRYWLSPEQVRAAGYEIRLPENIVHENYSKWLGTENQVARNANYAKFVPKETLFDVCVVVTVDECMNNSKSLMMPG